MVQLKPLHPSGAPRLLFLCQTLPYPVDSGVHIRAYHTLKALASRFDVTALFFHRASTRPDENAVAEGLAGVGRWASARSFPIPQDRDRIRLLWDHLRSVVLRRAYTVYSYDSRSYRRAVASTLANNRFDLIHIDSLDLSAYLPLLLPHAPVACSHHNVESRLMDNRGRHARQPLRAYMRLQANLLAEEERRWIPQMALNVAVSDVDASHLRGLAPTARILVVHNCVDTHSLTMDHPGTERGLVFVGGYSWRPNHDAMVYFCETVLPRIRAEIPDCPVTWVARATQQQANAFARRYDVTVLTFVEDIRHIIAEAACYVVPLRMGGGTRLKIVEAWAIGSAVVSTRVGVEGLLAEEDRNVLLADSPDEFAAAVVRVLLDSSLRSRLRAAGRETARTSYDWSEQGPRLAAAYIALLHSG